jgi:hypothetical protein
MHFYTINLMWQDWKPWKSGSKSVVRGSLGYATSSQRIRVYIFVMATLKFTYFLN